MEDKSWRLIDEEYVRNREQSRKLGYNVYQRGYLAGMQNGREVWVMNVAEAHLMTQAEAMRVLAWWRKRHGKTGAVVVG